MLNYVIEGGKKLKGEIKISGSKNAALPILAACILNPKGVTLSNVPNIEDTKITLNILEMLGCKIVKKSGRITILSDNIKSTKIPAKLMHKLRSTVILVGALIGRCNKATFSFPGGCNIGARPIDIHMDSLKKMGVKVEEKNEYIHCSTKELIGSTIKLSFPSVGATENIILSAVYAKGETKIENAAKEPEIIDLVRCLNKMGARIYGAGTGKIKIVGVQELKPISYTIMPDRIETGTFLCAAVITRGEVIVKSVNPQDLLIVLYKLKELGCKIIIGIDYIKLYAPKKIRAINIITDPFPSFPTDLQPLFGSVLCLGEGVSIIKENIFENRFKYCEELNKMGANIKIQEDEILIKGTNKIHSADVESKDLRGGAALVLAGLCAEGITRVRDISFILRGYESLEKKLQSLGANIKIEKVR